MVVAVGVGIVAGVGFALRRPELFNWPICYIWVTGLLLAYILRLLDLGRYVLPPGAHNGDASTEDSLMPGAPAVNEGMFLLFYHAVILPLLPLRLRIRLGLWPLKEDELPKELPKSFVLYRAGIVPSHLAVAINKGPQFSRAAGPGYVRLKPFERIADVIDLRLQLRSLPTEVVTQDGIPLKTTVSAVFQVREAGRPLDESGTLPYPYTPANIFRLIFADSTNAQEEINWTERLCPMIEGILAAEISKYRIDELFQPSGRGMVQPNPSPLVSIRENLRSELAMALRSTFDHESADGDPIQVLDADFGPLEPPPEVTAQRIDSWSVEWQQRQKKHQAESAAEAIRTRQTQRAALEEEMIADLSQMLQPLTRNPEITVKEVTLLRLLEALDRIVDEADSMPVRDDGPGEAIRSSDLEELKDMVNQMHRQLRQLSGGGNRP